MRRRINEGIQPGSGIDDLLKEMKLLQKEIRYVENILEELSLDYGGEEFDEVLEDMEEIDSIVMEDIETIRNF